MTRRTIERTARIATLLQKNVDMLESIQSMLGG
jgi:hypothetical protein